MSRLYFIGSSDTKKRFTSTGHEEINTEHRYGSRGNSNIAFKTRLTWYDNTEPAIAHIDFLDRNINLYVHDSHSKTVLKRNEDGHICVLTSKGEIPIKELLTRWES